MTTGRTTKKAAAGSDAAPAKKRRTAAPAVANGGGRSKHDLVIVESPAKAKTINKYLGPSFKVLASYGHVRDLPRRRRKGEQVAGVDIDAGWVPTYVVADKEDARGGKARSGRRTAKDVLAELRREAAKANRVYLATDPDREGEAIAWHIEDELALDDERTFRITFNEITRSAVQNALAHAGKVDMDRVHAQEARRILDRVVGYPLSGLLGKKVLRGSSAGRVQSVALRLVVDREREIEAFKPEEYWKLTAVLTPTGTLQIAPKPFELVEMKAKAAGPNSPPDAPADGKVATDSKLEAPPGAFAAELAEWNGQKVKDKEGKYIFPSNRDAAAAVADLLNAAAFRIKAIEQKDRSEKAPPPFITSTLQQQGSLRLHFTASRTMQIAQRLYEGVDVGGEGSVALITYMRTDSTRVSNEALQAVRGYIDANYGNQYLPEKPNIFSSGKSAQEAHEAIRPTDMANTPQRLSQLGLHGEQLRLYTLIFNRFVASQMTPAVFAVTNVDIDARCAQKQDMNDWIWIKPPEHRSIDSDQPQSGLIRTQGKILKFDGFRRVLAPQSKDDDATLPALAPDQALDRLAGRASQHSTQPPPRYNEASLIKALEKEGIGRPSTYASIIHKITSEERGYIAVRDRRFHATEIGKAVTDLLVQHFPRIMDLKFTSHMEEELDQIETKQCEYRQVLTEFWGPFSAALKEAETQMPTTRGQETGEMCPKCGRPLVRNYSKKTHRYFVGCSGWKEGCNYIKPVEGEAPRPEPIETEYKCPTCGKPMLQRTGPRGDFLGCSGFPACQTKMNFDAEGKPVVTAQPTEHTCEKCGKPMVIRQGRRGPFLACTGYPKCKNAKDVDAQGNPVQPIDTGLKCDKCGSAMIVRKGPRGPFLGCSAYPKCRNAKPIPAELKEQLKDQLPA
ncbi:MAG TPA: type I DNA topoisomerase, partial [Gemmataceae bacterium]|nr:type I DNA topoisomerase [Gemmataceae bacterium]